MFTFISILLAYWHGFIGMQRVHIKCWQHQKISLGLLTAPKSVYSETILVFLENEIVEPVRFGNGPVNNLMGKVGRGVSCGTLVLGKRRVSFQNLSFIFFGGSMPRNLITPS